MKILTAVAIDVETSYRVCSARCSRRRVVSLVVIFVKEISRQEINHGGGTQPTSGAEILMLKSASVEQILRLR